MTAQTSCHCTIDELDVFWPGKDLIDVEDQVTVRICGIYVEIRFLAAILAVELETEHIYADSTCCWMVCTVEFSGSELGNHSDCFYI